MRRLNRFFGLSAPYSGGRRRAQNTAACRLYAVFLALSVLAPSFAASARAQGETAAPQAVISIYHRFGENEIPLTNIRVEQFAAHVKELEKEKYNVVSLDRIAQAFKQGTPLPERAVAITVDDAYASFAENGWPLLKERGWPAILFVATDPVDQGLPGYLSWDAIRALKAEGLAIGHHGAGHIHMVDAGIKAAREDILRASDRFREELGEVPDLFAYPYGEYSLDLMRLVEGLGFEAAAAQYSSVAAPDDLYALPRFPFNERYSDMDRFRLIANAQALPVTDVVPAGPVIAKGAGNPPNFGFTLSRDVAGLAALACYPSHTGQSQVEILGGKRIEVEIAEAFPPGRHRVNCTKPGPGGRWYWYGKFFYVPGAPD